MTDVLLLVPPVISKSNEVTVSEPKPPGEKELLALDPKQEDLIIVYITKQAETELNDQHYRGLIHGTLTTRKMGCTGPLCRKALRDWARSHRRVKAKLTRTTMRSRSRPAQFEIIDPVLDRIQKQHKADLLARIEQEDTVDLLPHARNVSAPSQ